MEKSLIKIELDPARMYPPQTILGQVLTKLGLAIDKQTAMKELSDIFHSDELTALLGRRHEYGVDPASWTIGQVIEDASRSFALRRPGYIGGLAARGLCPSDFGRDVSTIESRLETAPRQLTTLTEALARVNSGFEVELLSPSASLELAGQDLAIMAASGITINPPDGD